LRALTARPASADLATLIAMADTDEVVRLRLLRAIRDLGATCTAPTASPFPFVPDAFPQDQGPF
jgi:hypothetical protein